MTIFIIILSILLIAIITTGLILFVKVSKSNIVRKTETIRDILDERAFYPSEIFVVNPNLIIALNKLNTKLAIVQNFNPNVSLMYDYKEISLGLIEKIEKTNFSIKLQYQEKGESQILFINPIKKELADFFHRIFKNAALRKIESKFPEAEFTLCGSSDWQCSYIWAYGIKGNIFAYYKTDNKKFIGKINIRKEHFTIDTKYKYFEAPIMGIPQQLMVYEKDFLSNLYELLFSSIKEKSGSIVDDSIYFDSYNNIVYLSNNACSLQSVLLEKIQEVYYRDNRISFALKNEQRQINFIASSQMILDFKEFVTNFNLKQIANNFNYKSDKLINTAKNTKFIIDFSRDRILYCANLDRFSSFRFIAYAFANLKEVSVEKSGMSYFLRIKTNEQTLDVTCDKKEVALYIEAHLKKIVS